jgi:hypothetical protein
MRKLSIIILGLLLVGCKKEEVDKLPDATAHGANTAGAIVDGKIWVAKYKGGSSIFNGNRIYQLSGGLYYIDTIRDADFQLHINKKWFNLRISNMEIGSGITISVNQVPLTGVRYNFNRNVCPEPMCLDLRNYGTYNDGSSLFITSSIHQGSVTFTKADTIAAQYAGTFEFTASDSKTGRVVRVTDGRFDYDQRFPER